MVPRGCLKHPRSAPGDICATCDAAIRRRDIQTLLKDARYRAGKQGIPFRLTAADIKWPKKCPLLNIPLIPKRGAGTGPWKWSPSLDRIIPKIGYVPGNVQIISARANILKRDSTLDELIALGKWARRRSRDALSA